MIKELSAQAYAVLHRHPDGQEMTRLADSTMPIKVAWRNPPDKSGVLLVLGAHEVQLEGGPDLRERVSRTLSEWIGSHRKESELSDKPAPKFAVGQHVVMGDEVGEVLARVWLSTNGTWGYQVTQRGGCVAEKDMKPAPKFAVGEWVTLPGGSGGVHRADWHSDAYHEPQWIYMIDRDDGVRDLKWESELTSQTPQYKHDCAGCVFLGRWSAPGWLSSDLYFCNEDGSLLTRWGDDERAARRVDSGSISPDHVECRRRAVARGLVK